MSDMIELNQMKSEISKLIDDFNQKIDSYLEAIKINSSDQVMNGSVEQAQVLLDLHQVIEGKKADLSTSFDDFIEAFNDTKS